MHRSAVAQEKREMNKVIQLLQLATWKQCPGCNTGRGKENETKRAYEDPRFNDTEFRDWGDQGIYNS